MRADLGASRFGPVYLGRDPSRDTRVVIRTFELPAEWHEFGEQSELLDAFRKLCATSLDCVGLARPLGSGAEGDIPYLVYAYLPGTPMDVIVRQDGARPVAEVLQRVTQLADAIDSAAAAGVYHGMLAPCDVVFDRDATGVTGFGLAQALIRVGIPVEASAPYASPQRLNGAPPTRADDVYSLAAITLELLIGTPADPNNDSNRALREAQGLPERRRVPRPAPHETRLFTTIAGVDAGLLRASFASGFSEEPGERPSTASEFVANFRDAVSNKRGADQPTPSPVAAFVSEPRVEEPAAPVPQLIRPVDGPTTLELPFRQERFGPERREAIAIDEPLIREPEKPLIREPQKPQPREREPEIRLARTEPVPIVREPLLAEVRPPFASSVSDAAYSTSHQSGGRGFVVVGLVVLSLAFGFAGGFLVGQRSRPLLDTSSVNHQEPVAETQSSRPVAEEPKSAAPALQASNREERVSSPEPITEPAPAVQPAVPVVQSGRLLVHSSPAGAGVSIDGKTRGVTPLALRDLSLGEHTIEVTSPGHDTRQQRVTLSAARPARSIEFNLRPTAAAAQPSNDPSLPGSLQIASRPSGAQVFVDDNLVGTTPLLVPNVASGSRRLRIELSGYQTWTTSVQVEPSARFRVSASLEQ